MEILLFLYFSSILFGIFKQRSLLSFVYIFVVAWIIMAGNTLNPDYDNYVVRYGRTIDSLGYQDFGFTLINTFFNEQGVAFPLFRAILSFFCLLSTFGIIYILCNRFSLVASLFLMTTFFGCAITLRSFLSISFLFIGIPFLLRGDNLGRLVYLLVTIFAATIHSSAIFYSVFALIGFKNLKYYVVVLIGVLYALKGSIVSTYEEELDVDKMSLYSDRISMIASLFFSLLLVVNAYIINNLANHYRINPGNRKNVLNSSIKNKKIKKIDKITYFRKQFTENDLWVAANWCMILLMPFYLDNLTYGRVFRNIVILNLAFISNTVFRWGKSPSAYVILFTYALYWGIRLYLLRIDYIAVPFFKYNIFFN